MKPLILTALLLSLTASAETLTLNAIQTGACSSSSGFDSHSYVTGIYGPYTAEARGFMAFDLTAIPAGSTVTGVTLLLENPQSMNEVGPGNPLTLRIYELPSFEAANWTQANAIANFSSIGGIFSPLHATRDLLPPDSGTTVSIPVNAAGIADINANLADSYYAYGMKIVKADAEEPKPLQYVFNGTTVIGTVQMRVTYTPAPIPAFLVALQPQVGGGMQLTWNDLGPMWSYTVEHSSTLAPANWQPVAGTWPARIFQYNPTPALGTAQGFYRVRAQYGTP
jgi:hypothetical protein